MVTLSEHLNNPVYFHVKSTQEAEFRTTQGPIIFLAGKLAINNCVSAMLSGQPKFMTI